MDDGLAGNRVHDRLISDTNTLVVESGDKFVCNIYVAATSASSARASAWSTLEA